MDTAHPSSTTRSTRLRDVVEHIAVGHHDDARRLLEKTLAELDTDRDGEDVRTWVFAAALGRRLSGKTVEQANLYLDTFDVPQIQLFNLLSQVPLVGESTRLANEVIARHVRTQTHPTLIDVGIGTGRQVVGLLETLASQGELPAQLTVIGIEPSDWSLELAAATIGEAAARLDIEVDFHGVCSTAETMSRAQWLGVAERCLERPVIAASFALHHIADHDGQDLRTAVLTRLRALDPLALVLAEPDVHHHEQELLARFDQCWGHFGHVFSLLDRLDLDTADRNALKVCFFGREIADILGAPDAVRTERHERVGSWLRRLREAGFALDSPARDLRLDTTVMSLSHHPGWLNLDLDEVSLISIICATPRGDAPRFEALPELPAAQRGAAHHERLDVQAYLAALIAVARSDEVVHDHEREFIERQARLLGLDAATLWQVPPLETVIERAAGLDRRTRCAIVRDLVYLARIDGEYHDDERALIGDIARRFDLHAEALAELEASACVPGVLEHAPSWLQQLWFLGDKH